MFSGFFDLLDNIDYFVSSREENLAKRNIQLLKLFCNCLTVVSVCYLIFRFTNIPGLLPEPCFWVMFAFMALFAIEHKFFLSKKKLSFKQTRIIVILHYLVLFAIFSLIEVTVVNDDKHLIIMQTLFMLVPAFYTDYIPVVAASEAIMFIEYLLVHRTVLGHPASWPQVFTGIAVITLSILVVMVYSGNQAQTASEEKEFKEKSNKDPLTGLKNKGAFEEECRNVLKEREPGTIYMLLILDFDNFKHVNDKYGHQTGDDVLKAFAKLLVREFRVNDIIGRVGGDEFMVMVTRLPSHGQKLIEDRCRNILHELNILKIGDAKRFSCSIGMIADDMGIPFEAMYNLADDALYEAKARGKAQFASWRSAEVHKDKDKLVYILTKDEAKRNRIIEELGEENNEFLTSDCTTTAFNQISLYQNYLNSIYIDMGMDDIGSSELEEYMASRPVFSKIKVNRI